VDVIERRFVVVIVVVIVVGDVGHVGDAIDRHAVDVGHIDAAEVSRAAVIPREVRFAGTKWEPGRHAYPTADSYPDGKSRAADKANQCG